ncbi:hypothetical protein EW145_g8308, partial [Phellinidium pouzarii]
SMAATSQPISIAPQTRSQSQGQTQPWPAKSPGLGEGSQSWSIHPGPLFVSSGSLGSIAGTSLSFGSKLYPGFSSAGQLLNSLESVSHLSFLSLSLSLSSSSSDLYALLSPSDFKCRVSSSIESDHSSLINSHMSEREIEQYRNFSCCGYPLPDMHELVEHFETHHVFLVDPSSSSSSSSSSSTTLSNGTNPPAATTTSSGLPARSTDSSLAGALGPANSSNSNINSASRLSHARQSSSLSLAMTGGVAAFDPDDMDLDIEADSPPSSVSSHSSPGAAGVALPGCLPHRFHANGTISSVSSPPDTPLLATPVSPVNGASFTNSGQGGPFPWSSPLSSDSGLATPTGPSAFDSVHLPAKNMSMFAHPYAAGQNAHARKMPHHFASMYALRGNAHAQSQQALVASAMNGYAGYSDYSSGFPGTIASGSSNNHMGEMHSGMRAAAAAAAAATAGGDMGAYAEGAIHPSLLFSTSAAAAAATVNGGAVPSVSGGRMDMMNSPRTTPAHSRAPSPSSSNVGASSSTGGKTKSSSSAALCSASTTLSRPSASLLLSKPFKCPKAGCMKSYKQANGLKYHVTHGQCNFTPPPELSSVEGLSEREAERRLRPFCCQVPPCQRRYKNMNGLRYHYQHSGDHGARGLALLASGNHDATKSQPSPPSISLGTDLPTGGNGIGGDGETPTTMSAPPTPAPANGHHS